nr:class I SAM-dependent methyltransferase [uncultured Desulfuromonas sp.]
MQLDSIVPWGRSFAEYRTMFMLTDADLQKSILGCSDGPAAFNAELTRRGGQITSVDPIYQFSRHDIAQRIDEVSDQVLSELKKNYDNYIWDHMSSVEALAATHMAAMNTFLEDYKSGLLQNRYINASLPNLPFCENHFDLALCSHFLFLYSEHLSLDFHLAALRELGRVAEEVRIYPLLTLDGKPSDYLQHAMDTLRNESWHMELQPVSYRFQKNANFMLMMKQV